jgi:hypothetical protein
MGARSCHHSSSPSRKRPRRHSATSQQRPRGSQPAMIQPQHQQGGHRLRRRPLPRHHRLPLQRLQQVYLPRLLLREVLFSPRAWPISPRGGTPRKGPWPSSRMCTGYDHELSPRDLRACLELLRTKTKKKKCPLPGHLCRALIPFLELVVFSVIPHCLDVSYSTCPTVPLTSRRATCDACMLQNAFPTHFAWGHSRGRGDGLWLSVEGRGFRVESVTRND